MLSRIIVIAAVVSASFSSSVGVVYAQNSSTIPVLTAQQEPAAFLASVAAATSTPAAAAQPGQPVRIAREMPKSGGGGLGMMSLYASTIALQALDVHSTMTALNRGAVEANPLMGSATSNKPVFFATKAAVAASTVFVANRLAKHNKRVAIVFLAAINSVYAGIVMHNYKVARELR